MSKKYNLKELKKKGFWAPDECYWMLVGDWPELDNSKLAGFIGGGGGPGRGQRYEMKNGRIFIRKDFDLLMKEIMDLLIESINNDELSSNEKGEIFKTSFLLWYSKKKHIFSMKLKVFCKDIFHKNFLDEQINNLSDVSSSSSPASSTPEKRKSQEQPKKKREDKFSRSDPDGKIQHAVKNLKARGALKDIVPYCEEIYMAIKNTGGSFDRSKDYKEQSGVALSTIKTIVRKIYKE